MTDLTVQNKNYFLSLPSFKNISVPKPVKIVLALLAALVLGIVYAYSKYQLSLSGRAVPQTKEELDQEVSNLMNKLSIFNCTLLVGQEVCFIRAGKLGALGALGVVYNPERKEIGPTKRTERLIIVYKDDADQVTALALLDKIITTERIGKSVVASVMKTDDIEKALNELSPFSRAVDNSRPL